MWPFKKPPIGLDIGSRTIKALKLKKRGKKIVLDKFFFYDLAEGNAKFPTIHSLHESLTALVEVHGFANQDTVTCIPEGDVAIFDLILPKMPENDLVAAVAGEVEQLISFPLEQASIGHVVVSPVKNGATESLQIKAFCVRIDDVKKIADLLETSSLQPESIEYAMLSNISMLNFNGYLDDESYTVLLDLGESKTSAALLKGKKLVATTSMQVSFGTINSSLQSELGISYLEAEKIKRDVTLKSNAGEPASQDIVENVYVELFQELQQSVEFFQIKTDDNPISKIFAIGGGSQYPSVLQAIKASCGVDTVAANPFRNIDIFTKDKFENERIGQLAPYMGTAVGLALRRLERGLRAA
jgi:type IV pilus assembly protein PilM